VLVVNFLTDETSCLFRYISWHGSNVAAMGVFDNVALLFSTIVAALTGQTSLLYGQKHPIFCICARPPFHGQ
jgi:hypothetical protein